MIKKVTKISSGLYFCFQPEYIFNVEGLSRDRDHKGHIKAAITAKIIKTISWHFEIIRDRVLLKQLGPLYNFTQTF